MEIINDALNLVFEGVKNYLFKKENLEDTPIKELIEQQYQLEQTLDKMKDAKSLLENQLTRIKKNILPDKMDQEGIKSMRIDGIGNIRVQGDLYASIRPAEKEKAFTWLQDNGHSGLVNSTINANSLRSLAKQYQEKGDSLPKELFSIIPFSKTIITK